MRKHVVLSLCLLAGIAGAADPGVISAPVTLTYTGYIVDEIGGGLTQAALPMQFALHADEASPSTGFWESGPSLVAVQHG